MAACFSADIVIHLSTTMAMLPAIDFVLNVEFRKTNLITKPSPENLKSRNSQRGVACYGNNTQ